MIIDFEKIQEVNLKDFRGGKGILSARNFNDDNLRINLSTLRPNATMPVHPHVQSSEITFIISGTATFTDNGREEVARSGQVHYCPMGHTHSMDNRTDHDILFLTIVPQHHS